MYHLRSDNRATCKDWVITLNRVKEARLQQGNVKLLNRTVDFFHDSEENVTPRVVVVANRQRTRAVDEDGQWNQLYQTPDDPENPLYLEQKRLSAIGTAAVARWSKRRSILQRLGSKLARWAKSVKKYGCQDVDTDDIALDRHVHPPGHDDQNRLSTGKLGGDRYASNYQSKVSGSQMPPQSITTSGVVPTGTMKPSQPNRSHSASSEYYPTIS
jgi:hypothetical protein